MSLTPEMAQALAPDAASLTAGRKLATARNWQGLGRDEHALWGECQGSARYQVRTALPSLTAKCSCPSRKYPASMHSRSCCWRRAIRTLSPAESRRCG